MQTGMDIAGNMVYAETSVLASLVMSDTNSGRATDLTSIQVTPLLLNRLLKLEVCNAIRLRVAGGNVNEAEASESWKKLEELERSGFCLVREPDWDRVFQRSIGFSRAHSSVTRTRSFDILHVAAAVELGATEFWSFDKRQRALAAEVGLRVNPL